MSEAAANASLLSVENLWIEATIEDRVRPLVTGVDLRIEPGEVVAIVGESGSGKSLTARALVGLLPRGLRASGIARFEGADLLTSSERELQAIRGQGVGLVLQDPFTMLNPLMKCYAQLVPTSGPRLSKRERIEGAVRRLAEVGIHDPNVAERYPWQLSGGMRQRVALASALANDPKLLVADEFSTALDVTTQKEIWLLLRRIQESREMGLLIITHDLRMAFSMCDRVHVMYAGSMMEVGAAEEVSDHPLHPYTMGLLLSEPDISFASSAELLMRGSVPRADDVVDRCAFSERCPWSTELCVAVRPPLLDVEGERLSACIRIEEIDSEMTALRKRQAEVAPGVEEAAHVEGVEPAVVVENLRKVFHAEKDGKIGERSVVALDDVTLQVQQGESVALVGESGSGKTTLARCLVGLENPTSGTMRIGDIDASKQGDFSREEWRRLRNLVQYVFQDPYSSLNPTKTIGATIGEAASLRLGRDKRAVSARVAEMLSIVGLSPSYRERKPVALSGGERQRVAIARALALEPKVIICDEPVSALDVSVQAQVLELLNKIRIETGVSYLFITHDLAVVRQVAERVYVLRKGELVETGSVDELLGNPKDQYTQELLAAVPGQWDRDSGLSAADKST